MFEIFNINSRKLFKIQDFKLNIPLNIKTLDDQFLSCDIIKNIVDFYYEDDNSNRQKWIIEKDENDEGVFYMKCAFQRYNFTQYLGCPSINNEVYLYTSKNKYTRWNIQHMENDIYSIKYVGEKFDKNDVTIIVARYNEDIQWLTPLMNNVIIFNKGNELHLKNEILLNNVGRESETYLNYIINYYDKLPNIVVFTQANISDHRDMDGIEYLTNLINETFDHDKSIASKIHYETNNFYYWDKNWNIKDYIYYLEDNYKNNTPVVFEDWFKQNINCEYPNPIHIYTNGIFGVKRELILQNPIEYYKKLITEVNHHINPSEGHFLERSWYYIFSRNFNNYSSAEKNIFTIWTKGEIIDNKDIISCFISMSINNLDKNIYIISNVIDEKIFSNYSNIFIVKYSLDILLINTPVYNEYFNNIDRIKKCKYWYSHETDLIRFVILYKYGGIYLDSDILVFKNIKYELIKNTISLEGNENDSITGSAYLCFEKNHPFLKKILKNFWNNWDENHWSCVGPDLLNKYRNEIQLLPYYFFYPISYKNITYYGINEDKLQNEYKNVLSNINNSYGMHLWNSRLKKHLFNEKYDYLIIDTNSFLYKQIQKYLPTFEIPKTNTIILNNSYKLIQNSNINTLYSLYNYNLNKFIYIDFNNKVNFVDKHEESSIVLYKNNNLYSINLQYDMISTLIDINNL